MSVPTPKTDIRRQPFKFRFVPIATNAPQQNPRDSNWLNLPSTTIADGAGTE